MLETQVQRLGRSPEGGNDNPLRYSHWGNPLDRGAWWAAVRGVTESQARLSGRITAAATDGMPVSLPHACWNLTHSMMVLEMEVGPSWVGIVPLLEEPQRDLSSLLPCEAVVRSRPPDLLAAWSWTSQPLELWQISVVSNPPSLWNSVTAVWME